MWSFVAALVKTLRSSAMNGSMEDCGDLRPLRTGRSQTRDHRPAISPREDTVKPLYGVIANCWSILRSTSVRRPGVDCEGFRNFNA